MTKCEICGADAILLVDLGAQTRQLCSQHVAEIDKFLWDKYTEKRDCLDGLNHFVDSSSTTYSDVTGGAFKSIHMIQGEFRKIISDYISSKQAKQVPPEFSIGRQYIN